MAEGKPLKSKQYPTGLFSCDPVEHIPEKPVLPSCIRDKIISVLNENAEGITYRDFLLAYKKKFGEKLNYHSLGFLTLYECLECIPNVWSGFVEGELSIVSFHKEPKVEDRGQNTKPTLDLKDFSREWETLHLSKFDPSNISKSMKDNFRKIVLLHPEGITAFDFSKYYEKLTGNKLDLSEMGIFTFVDLADSLPEIFESVPPEMQRDSELLFLANKKLRNLGVSGEFKFDILHDTVYMDKIIKNIRMLLRACPEGVYLDEFVQIYKVNCEEDLRVAEFGCLSVEHFLLKISQRVPLAIDDKFFRRKVYLTGIEPSAYNTELIFFDEGSTVPSSIPSSASSATEPSITENFSNSANAGQSMHKPSDSVFPWMQYVYQKFPIESETRTFHHVYLSTIMDPDNMYLQLVGPTTSCALHSLLNEMDAFYKSPRGDDYMMPDEDVHHGTVCAAVYNSDNFFYRVAITGVNFDGRFVDAFFVDYGTQAVVYIKSLRYLRKKFFELPAQAIKCRMAFVRPISGHTWDRRVCSKLIESCRNKKLLAQAFNIPEHPHAVSVWLSDVSGKKEICLNVSLVNEGFAGFDAIEVGYSSVINSPAEMFSAPSPLFVESGVGFQNSNPLPSAFTPSVPLQNIAKENPPLQKFDYIPVPTYHMKPVYKHDFLHQYTSNGSIPSSMRQGNSSYANIGRIPSYNHEPSSPQSSFTGSFTSIGQGGPPLVRMSPLKIHRCFSYSPKYSPSQFTSATNCPSSTLSGSSAVDVNGHKQQFNYCSKNQPQKSTSFTPLVMQGSSPPFGSYSDKTHLSKDKAVNKQKCNFSSQSVSATSFPQSTLQGNKSRSTYSNAGCLTKSKMIHSQPQAPLPSNLPLSSVPSDSPFTVSNNAQYPPGSFNNAQHPHKSFTYAKHPPKSFNNAKYPPKSSSNAQYPSKPKTNYVPQFVAHSTVYLTPPQNVAQRNLPYGGFTTNGAYPRNPVEVVHTGQFISPPQTTFSPYTVPQGQSLAASGVIFPMQDAVPQFPPPPVACPAPPFPLHNLFCYSWGRQIQQIKNYENRSSRS